MNKSDYYFLRFTREESARTRGMIKHLKSVNKDETLTGLRMERYQRIRFLKRFISELQENCFLKKKALETAELEQYIDDIKAVKKTKPYEWQKAKDLYEKSMEFVKKQKTLAYYEIANLYSAMKGL